MANELKSLLEQRTALKDELFRINEEHEESIGIVLESLAVVLESIADHVESDTPKPAPKRRTKKLSPQPDHEATARRYADLEPAATGCLCGCGEHVADDVNFVRGHQKRLQSIARAVGADKLSPDKMSDAGYTYAKSQGWIEKDD